MSLTRLQPNSVNTTADFTFGNVTANYFIGNGALLTGISVGSTYSNTNVASYIPTYTGNISPGNIVSSNVYISSLGSGQVAIAYTSGKILGGSDLVWDFANAKLNTTSITATGNITANYFIGNGSLLTGLPESYSNTNVAGYLPTYTGNISANYFIGNGSTLTYITGANVTGYVPNATNANTAGTVTTAAQPNITSVGTLSSLTVTGLITATGTGIKTSNIQDSTGTVTLTTKYNNVAGDVGVYGNIVAGTSGDGNVTATYFIGNGSQLTGVTVAPAGSNTQVQFNDGGVFGADASFTFNKSTGILSVGSTTGGSLTGANLISANYFTGTLTTASQPNITSVGTLTSLTTGTHTISANSNIAMSGTLSQISGANLVSASYITGTLTTAAQPNITSIGSLTSLTLAANSNITMSGSLSRISGANLVSGTYLTGTLTTAAQPNITSVGTLTSATITTATITTGNITTGNFANSVFTKFQEKVVAGGNTGAATITPDASAGTIYTYTVTGAITLNTLANAVAGTSMTIILTQGGSGSYVLTSTMKFAGGSKTLSTAVGTIDIISVFYDGTTYYASLSKGYA